MENNTPESGGSFMEKLSTFIVDKRNLIYLIVVLPLSIVAASKVKALLSHRLERPKAYF